MYIVGFDPGGEMAFGWAVLSVNNDDPSFIASGTCTGAPTALSAARAATPTAPIAFGIDAPLFWAETGDRRADVIVRGLVLASGGNAGTVNHVNSLRGACLVQGILVARLSAALWPSAMSTEAHPKALLVVSSAARKFATQIDKSVRTEHERDAALAAYAAFALAVQTDGWHDLVETEQNPFFPGGQRVAYWFPRSHT